MRAPPLQDGGVIFWAPLGGAPLQFEEAVLEGFILGFEGAELLLVGFVELGGGVAEGEEGGTAGLINAKLKGAARSGTTILIYIGVVLIVAGVAVLMLLKLRLLPVWPGRPELLEVHKPSAHVRGAGQQEQDLDGIAGLHGADAGRRAGPRQPDQGHGP